MESVYKKLNKKLDDLTQGVHRDNKHKEQVSIEDKRVINMSKITFTKEQLDIMKLGPQYAIEKDPKQYINELIVDTENAIRHLNSSVQNTFRYLAAKNIQQIKESNRQNIIHKRKQHNIKQIKKILRDNNLTIAKADKSKAMVIIDKIFMEQKIYLKTT